MFVENKLKEAGYTEEEIVSMLSAKANTGLAWKSIIILREQKKDNDIFGDIVSKVVESHIFNSISEVDKFIQTINTMEIPDLGELYNR